MATVLVQLSFENQITSHHSHFVREYDWSSVPPEGAMVGITVGGRHHWIEVKNSWSPKFDGHPELTLVHLKLVPLRIIRPDRNYIENDKQQMERLKKSDAENDPLWRPGYLQFLDYTPGYELDKTG
jgi:hypothetical protein